MQLTPAELTVLGLIIESPQHGYDLEQVIADRGIRQWTDIGFSSIYYLLAKLDKRGYIERQDPPSGPKSRRIYRATAQGRAAAAEGAVELIENSTIVRQPVLAGLANLPLLSAYEYVGAIRARLASVEDQLAQIKAARRDQEPLPQAAREVFSYALSLLEAERAWLASHTLEVSDDGQD